MKIHIVHPGDEVHFKYSDDIAIYRKILLAQPDGDFRLTGHDYLRRDAYLQQVINNWNKRPET